MRQNPHVRICGGPGSATTLVYPTMDWRGQSAEGVVDTCQAPDQDRLSTCSIRSRCPGRWPKRA